MAKLLHLLHKGAVAAFSLTQLGEGKVALRFQDQNGKLDYKFTGNFDGWQYGSHIFSLLGDAFVKASQSEVATIFDFSCEWLYAYVHSNAKHENVHCQLFISDPDAKNSPHPTYANYKGDVSYRLKTITCTREEAQRFGIEIIQEANAQPDVDSSEDTGVDA